MTTQVGILGATGYAGAELIRIIAGHPQADISVITSRQYAGSKISDIYPAFRNVIDLECITFDVDRVCSAADLIFMALPHKLPMTIVPDLIRNQKKVIDLSADFRFTHLATYESVYQPHTAKEFNEEAVYGLSEIHQDQIQKSNLIGNPGCYPTSVLLPTIPLLKNGLLDPTGLVADSKSGVSGAGRSLALSSHFCEVNESFKAYKVGVHRHNPEMDEKLSEAFGSDVHISFVPHLIPLSRGMLTTIYATLGNHATAAKVRECLQDTYKNKPFIRIYPEGTFPDTRNVKGTNYCDIGFKVDAVNNRLILISAIDNLVKGAAGQAVQNMNIMLGYNESAGLNQMPYPI